LESVGFTCKKMFFIAYFHVLGLFIPKNKFKAKKNFRLSRGVASVTVRSLVEICIEHEHALLVIA
jgi:hypothetical protein